MFLSFFLINIQIIISYYYLIVKCGYAHKTVVTQKSIFGNTAVLFMLSDMSPA